MKCNCKFYELDLEAQEEAAKWKFFLANIYQQKNWQPTLNKPVTKILFQNVANFVNTSNRAKVIPVSMYIIAVPRETSILSM